MTMSMLRPRKAQIQLNHDHFVYYRNRTRRRVLQLTLQTNIRFYERSLLRRLHSASYIFYTAFFNVFQNFYKQTLNF